jgi:hypothetical protein
MSLLLRGTDAVAVYAEEVTTDEDGNIWTRPSAVGVMARAVVQPIGAPTESQDGGFETVAKYRLRLVGYADLVGAQAQIEWNGQRWSIDGEPRIHNGSPKTRHIDYVIVRS